MVICMSGSLPLLVSNVKIKDFQGIRKSIVGEIENVELF